MIVGSIKVKNMFAILATYNVLNDFSLCVPDMANFFPLFNQINVTRMFHLQYKFSVFHKSSNFIKCQLYKKIIIILNELHHKRRAKSSFCILIDISAFAYHTFEQKYVLCRLSNIICDKFYCISIMKH